MRDPTTQRLAKQLRSRLTESEQHLWKHLRRRNLRGFRFRRQFPIGPYIADFVCLTPPLVIELDGGQHSMQVARDQMRDKFLRNCGFRVLRFWDNEALQQTDAVLEVIRRALEEPPPCPPPATGGGEE
jgi:very-short-patch-repair endonuclease